MQLVGNTNCGLSHVIPSAANAIRREIQTVALSVWMSSVSYLKMADTAKQLVVEGSNNTFITAADRSTIMGNQDDGIFDRSHGSVSDVNNPASSGMI